MAHQCPRCGRSHSGICGIPAASATLGISRVTIGPAGPTGDSCSTDAKRVKPRARFGNLSRPSHARRTSQGIAGEGKTLDKLLVEARRQEKEVLSTLKATHPKLDEYDQLMRQLDGLHGVIIQLNRQIARSRAGA